MKGAEKLLSYLFQILFHGYFKYSNTNPIELHAIDMDLWVASSFVIY